MKNTMKNTMTVCVVLMSMAFLCPIAGAQSEKQGIRRSRTCFLRSEVETAVSMLRGNLCKARARGNDP